MKDSNSLNSKTILDSKNSMFLNPIVENDLLLNIKRLNSKKAGKSDCIATKFIKISAEAICPTLTKIFNRCISEGIFPKSLKQAELIPIYKKGDILQKSNHRPISLLPPFSKLLERHIHTEITKFINKYQLMHQFQYGFRQNSSTEQAITQLTEELSNNIQNKNYTCSIFVDMKKAFDTINHEILLQKLKRYGIRGLPLKLLRNYLTDRQQRTKINNTFSSPKLINCGIPQGSILGPLLFNLFINDLPNASKFSVRLFADDACLTLHDKSPDNLEQAVNNELLKISNWININKLTINYKKTNYIIFTRLKYTKNFNIQMQNNKIEKVSEIKYLGVYLDEKIDWNYQIKTVEAKIARASYILSKIRYYVNLNTLKTLYYALVYPFINYCVTAWGGVSNSKLDSIIKLQKRTVRILTKSEFDSPSLPLFISLNILPFHSIYNYNLLILMHKIKNKNFVGTYNLTNLQQIHTYETRLATNSNFYTNFHHTNLGQSLCSFQGLKLWRSIPNEIKTLPLHLFKKAVKKELQKSLKNNL